MTLLVSLVAAGGLVAGCSGSQPATSTQPASTQPPTTAASSSAAAAAPTADWPTYHHDNARTGLAADLAPLGTLRQTWNAKLDGAVYGQPLVVGGMILAATENDSVYALDPAAGKVLWREHVGTPQPREQLPCGDISPLGITSTMAYDQATGRVFAVAETPGGEHTLYGFDVRTGHVDVRVNVDPPRGSRIAHQQRGALTVLNGRVDIPYGALAGDCADYVGTVMSVTTSGGGRLGYTIPTPRQGGVWGPAGGTVYHGNILYEVGNGSSTSKFDGSDSVIELSPTLSRVDFFAPATWADDNATDLSLGSSNPTLVGPWVWVGTKRPTGFVLRAGKLGGIGGEVSKADGCPSFGGTSVRNGVVYLPCTDGPRAIGIDSSGHVSIRWHASVPATGAHDRRRRGVRPRLRQGHAVRAGPAHRQGARPGRRGSDAALRVTDALRVDCLHRNVARRGGRWRRLGRVRRVGS
jgi:hypothetical protein